MFRLKQNKTAMTRLWIKQFITIYVGFKQGINETQFEINRAKQSPNCRAGCVELGVWSWVCGAGCVDSSVDSASSPY